MRTLAGEKVNEKNMITNYDAHGFMVAAEEREILHGII